MLRSSFLFYHDTTVLQLKFSTNIFLYIFCLRSCSMLKLRCLIYPSYPTSREKWITGFILLMNRCSLRIFFNGYCSNQYDVVIHMRRCIRIFNTHYSKVTIDNIYRYNVSVLKIRKTYDLENADNCLMNFADF